MDNYKEILLASVNELVTHAQGLLRMYSIFEQIPMVAIKSDPEIALTFKKMHERGFFAALRAWQVKLEAIRDELAAVLDTVSGEDLEPFVGRLSALATERERFLTATDILAEARRELAELN